MKATEIKVGESYAYRRGQYGATERLEVTSVAQGSVPVNGSRYRMRKTIIITGTLHSAYGGRPRKDFTAEPRHLRQVWSEYAAQREANKAAREEYDARILAERQARVEPVRRIEALLVAAGAPDTTFSAAYASAGVLGDENLSDVHFDLHEAVGKGTVEISLNNLIALINHLAPGSLA